MTPKKKKERPASTFDLPSYERGLTLFSTLVLRIGVRLSQLPQNATDEEGARAVRPIVNEFIENLSSADCLIFAQMIHTVLVHIDWENIAVKLLVRAFVMREHSE